MRETTSEEERDITSEREPSREGGELKRVSERDNE